MELPFLAKSTWPISKEPEERVVNPSYDKQLQDHLIEELLRALESRDRSEIKECLLALIQSIENEELES